VILFFGLIKRYKGLEYLVEAFEEVRRRVNDAFLLIVGDVYAADAVGHAFYSNLIERLRGRDDVLCVARYVALESVGGYLAASDVIVLPYARTFQSGVLLAAYAAGKPVVVTDTGGLGEAVEQGKSGVVVSPRDPKALAEGIISVLSDPKLRSAMGERARVLARTVYSWDAIAARTTELYESVLGTETDSWPNRHGKAGTSPAKDGRTAHSRADEGRRIGL
jgi:glycosyltransferase involved in cell wall biosynthesis